MVSSLFLRSNFRILALTRNPSAASSRSLLNRKWTSEPVEALLELVQGDLDKPLTIRKIFEAEGNGGIAAVFVALAFPGLGARADKEEAQGIVSLSSCFASAYIFCEGGEICLGLCADSFFCCFFS